MQTPKRRLTPRISVNKLAEYMVATPARRRGIIRDQKQPRDIIVARYSEVYAAVVDCLVHGNDVSRVYGRLEKLFNAVPRSTWDAQDKQLSAEALESFLSFVDDFDASAFTARPAAENAPHMKLAGVDVSVKPDLLLYSGGDLAGAAKVYVSKLLPFDDKSGAYASVALHQYLQGVLSAQRSTPANCWVIDVFARNLYFAPRAYKKKRADLEAACEEIAQRWDAVAIG